MKDTCKKDRSFAIAHGLEALCETKSPGEEGEGGIEKPQMDRAGRKRLNLAKVDKGSRLVKIKTKMPVTTQTPDAEGLEVIVLGSFNPAIFHPEWFLRHNLIGDQDAKDAKVKMVSGDVTDLELCGLKLFCIGDRLVLGTSNISRIARIQDLLVQIFTLLPHTPVIACGINPRAHYQMANTDYWNKIGHTLAPKELIWNDLFKHPGMQSLVIKSPREGDFPGEIIITVGPSPQFPPGIFIKSNYHFGLPLQLVHVGATELLINYLRREWDPACEMARRVANMIFDKIKPDNE